MPEITVNDTTLYYEDTGGEGPVILFAHGLMFSSQMFEFQIERLQESYRCISFDFRGQGLSESPKGTYRADMLIDDTIALIQRLNIAPVHFAGHSMGGYIGLKLASEYPELVQSLTLMATSSDAEDPEGYKRLKWMSRIGRMFGYTLVTGKVMRRYFGPAFREDSQLYEEQLIWRNRLLSNNRKGIARAVAGIIEREDLTDRLSSITCPTLILVGEDDQITPPSHSEKLSRSIPNATLYRIPQAGHMLSAEAPDEVCDYLVEHLSRQIAQR